MNPMVFVYLLAAGCFLLPLAGYFLIRFLTKKREGSKASETFSKVIAAISVTAFLVMLFFTPVAMTTKLAGVAHYNPNIGCVELVGVPYGDNKTANFFAWLHLAFFLASGGLTALLPFLPNRHGHFLQRFVLLPILFISLCCAFNLENAFVGSIQISYKSALVACSIGLCAGNAFIDVLEHKNEKGFGPKDIVISLLQFVFVFGAFLPMCTFAILVPTESLLFGRVEHSWRIEDFGVMHRLYLYIGIAFNAGVYAALIGDDENARRAILLALCFGALASFFTDYGFEGIFSVSNNYKLMPTRLPIHLCHTALFVTPLCIAFKWKKVFYFTYFINVFGALMAMMHPNMGEGRNIFDPEVLLFWWNHIAALAMPLITVMLRVFPRPKMKDMGWSLLAFTLYFILIMFANGYLSNFVSGYNPNVLGSGTDYLFINNDYILDIFGEKAKHMLDIKAIFPVGDLTVVIYPLYQSLFFIGYMMIAFLMWFVYSLFFRIEDGHIELRARYHVARASALTFKEAKAMKTAQIEEQEPASCELVFKDFSKRYGSSARLSADHVNLSVKAGEIFGFLGPNGAGKSTCIKSAIGIQPITEGSITVCGYDITHEPALAKRCIGYVPDHYALYEKLTGREYINYVADLYSVSTADRDQRIEHFVKLFELTQSFDSRMETYSHGMKQKIAIMAALVHEPKVWILDEPLTGLDPQSIFQVKQTLIQHAEKGNVVFFSSHIIDVVERLCTRIAIIQSGRIVYEGSMQDLERDHPKGLEKFYMTVTEEAVDGE